MLPRVLNNRGRASIRPLVLPAAIALVVAPTLTCVPAAMAATPAPAGPAAAQQISPARQNWLDDQESPTHRYTAAQAVAQARRFALISALPGTYDRYVRQMKAANPGLKIVVYMNGTMADGGEFRHASASWLLHDRRGRRITNSWHLTLMNPASPGWVADRVRTCAKLVRQTGYNGCFLDNLGTGTWAAGMASGTPLDPGTRHPYRAAAWLADTAHLADAVRDRTHTLVVGNGLVDGSAYFNRAAPSAVLFTGSPIGCAESWLRTARQPLGSYQPVRAWRADVDMLANAAARGRSVATITKVWAHRSRTQVDAWHRFALGSFLLGSTGGQYFEFSDGPGDHIADGDELMPRLTPLGASTGPYRAAGGIYRRPFTGGLVVVNPGNARATVHLARGYTDAFGGGHVHGALTLAPHTTRFLLS